MSQCEEHVSQQEPVKSVFSGWMRSMCVWDTSVWFDDVSENIKALGFTSANAYVCTFIWFVCAHVSDCVCVLVCFRAWTSPGGLPLLLLFFAVRWKAFPNICTTYHHGKKKGDSGLKLSIGRACGFYFIGLSTPCWYMVVFTQGNLKSSQRETHLLKTLKP